MQKRGNSENFIREKKIHLGSEALSLPQDERQFRLRTDRDGGLQFSSEPLPGSTHPDKPHYAKKLREKYIYIPAKVVKHARQMFLANSTHFREEVEAMQSGWAGTLEAALAMG